MKLLIFCPASYGGIADYAHEQANALCDAGVEVTLLCTKKYPIGRGEKYHIVSILREQSHGSSGKSKIVKDFLVVKAVLENYYLLAGFIEKNNFKQVLLGTYAEFMAPFWAWRLRRVAKKGVVFGAIIHDPVRDFVVGPLWWHRWSIAEGYSFIRDAFVHEEIKLDTAWAMPQLRITSIPHGLYPHVLPSSSREEIRREFNLPSSAKVMLSFGHIHPHRKNIDLIIRALVYFPDMYLIIAGEDTSIGQRISASYKDLAVKLGVAQQCRWMIEFIPALEVANLFEVSDVLMLAYRDTFHSASGVLSTAVSYRKPCIASGGPGALETVVKKYGLGIWVEPDSLDSLKAGIKKWQESSIEPQWERYCRENSWKRNAELTLRTMAREKTIS